MLVTTERAQAPAGATVLPVPDGGSAELADVLDAAAGVVVRRLGGLGAWSGVSLRGQGFRQTQLHLDGVPLNPDGVDAVNLAELPLAALSEVWVFRGRAPATYGASPVGGLIDLRTGRGPAPPRLLASAGSFGSVRTAASGGLSGHLGAVPTDVSIAVDVLGTRADFPYVDDGGTRYDLTDDAVRTRAWNDRVQAAAQGRWRVGHEAARFTLLDTFVARDEALPGPIGAPASAARLGTTRNLAVLQGEGALGAGRLTGRLWHLWRAEHLDDALGEVGLGAQVQRDDFHTVGGQLEGQGAPRPWISVRGSLSARWEGFGRTDLTTGRTTEGASRAVAGLAAEVGFHPWQGRLSVTPSVDVRLIAPEDDAPRFAANPGLVIEGRPGPVVLRLAGGGVFRPPDLTELYGDRGAIVGNPDLQPESGWNGDLTLRWDSGPVDVWSVGVEAAGFVVALQDRITWVQNAQRTVVPVNLGQALTTGAELAAHATLLDVVEARVSLTWTEALDLTDADPARAGKRLPFVPRFAVDHTLAGTWPDRLRLAWTLSVQDGTFTDTANLGVQPPRVLHGLALRVHTAPLAPWVEVEVRNLGDQRTGPVPRDALAGDPTPIETPVVDFFGYPLPGRTLWVTLGWTPGSAR